jgi:TolB-like protein/Tfp pilus assembly protein PilF
MPQAVTRGADVVHTMALLAELKRRNVFRVIGLYLAGSWLLLQISEALRSALALPAWSSRLVLLVLALGFPVAVTFAWIYELTPDGLKREREILPDDSTRQVSARRLNLLTIAFAALALAAVVADRLLPPRISGASSIPARTAEPLSQSRARAPTAGLKAIAVLPFVNMSSDPEQEFFSDGVSEEILNLLANVEGLRVTSRTSSFSFRGRQVDLPTIARQLGVGYVVEGSVRKAGDRVRVTAQLIDVSADTHVWSETYERQLDDVFAIQADVAGQIARSLEIAIGTDELASLGRRPTQDIEAWQQFLKARDHVRNRKSMADLREALLHVDAALEKDPAFARAHSMRAVVLMLMPSWGGDAASFETERVAEPTAQDLSRGEAQWAQALAAASRALQLEPKLGEPYVVRALHAETYNRYADAEKNFREAIARAPGNPDARNWYGQFLLSAGYLAKGFAETQRAAAIDPLSPMIAWQAAYAGLIVGRFDVIEAYSARARENGWSGWQAMIIPGGAAMARGDLDRAEQIMVKALPQRQKEIQMSMAAVRRRQIDRATRAMLDRLDAYGPPGIARFAVLAQVGDVDGALATIFGTVDPDSLLAPAGSGGPARPPKGHGPGRVIRADWWFRPAAAMRMDPRFAQFMRDIGLVSYWREYGWPDLCQPVADSVQCR